MQEIKRIAILGAGAIGAMYASIFYSCREFEIGLVASGDRHDRLKRDGINVNGIFFDLNVYHPGSMIEPVDLVIVALKHHQLADALPDLVNLIGVDTIMISVMNGLDSEKIIAEIYGWDKVLYCIAVGMDALRVDNKVTFITSGKLLFGEAENLQLSERVIRVQDALDRAGIACEIPEDMIRALWWKFMVNVGMNQSTAVMRAPYGIMQSSQDAQAVMKALMGEIIDLARVADVNLSYQDIVDWYEIMHRLSPNGKTSMLQDLEAG